MNPRATAQPAPFPGATRRPLPQPRSDTPRPQRRTAPPTAVSTQVPAPVPTWPAVLGTSCRRHLADLAILLLTLVFVVAGASVGLLLIHGAW
jgi:hypothetical protein